MSTDQIYFELNSVFQTKPQTKSVPQINFSIISYILIFFNDKTNHNEIYDKFVF
jgi:hypothetical protein